MEQQKDVEISVELTPNPNTLKFVVDAVLLASGSKNFPDAESAKEAALPAAIFEVPKVSGVMIGRDFISISKEEAADWKEIVNDAVAKMREFFKSGRPAVPLSMAPDAAPAHASSPIEEQIKAILDNEIRPAIERDGGDIVFYGYDNGVVKLHLQGACSTCPSSVLTLKMGIENRLKQAIPEIREVQQV